MSAEMATTAQDRARLIREGLAAVWDLLTAAYDAEDWKTLGYPSWEAYCNTEFRGQIPRLGKGERGGVVQGLAAHGMPIKAIAAATGLARNTVRADLRPADEGGQIDPSVERRERARLSMQAARAALDDALDASRNLVAIAEQFGSLDRIAEKLPDLEPAYLDELANCYRADGTVRTAEEMLTEALSNLDATDGASVFPRH